MRHVIVDSIVSAMLSTSNGSQSRNDYNDQKAGQSAADVAGKTPPRVLTGQVTKLLDNFGFIDDSVFFQLSAVKGGEVRVGDKVYCECTFSEHLPFKWNASKVHVVQSAVGPNASARAAPALSMLDYSKAREAVAAAQQLAQYYTTASTAASVASVSVGQPSVGPSSGLQYTSTPGSAFVSPFAQQIQSNLMSTQSRAPPPKQGSSRWEREPERYRAAQERTPRTRDDVKDEFGRDLRRADRERERPPKPKRSVSPPAARATGPARRRYEPANVPKLAILKNPLNVYDIKQRYSANLHVPSDLKEVVINGAFALNIADIPKPIAFRVIDVKQDNNNNGNNGATKKATRAETTDAPKKAESAAAPEATPDSGSGDGATKSSSSSSSSAQNKYGVKVLIVSLPSMSDIYDRMFGSDFDAVSTGSKAYFVHFNKLLAFLVSRNTNDGFSLIGGKFQAHVDGFLQNDEPNLVATAVRVVHEQTGMNLAKCAKWRLIASFVYNRDNSVDPLAPSLEVTRVYMPDIWSAMDSIYDEPNVTRVHNNTETETNIVVNSNRDLNTEFEKSVEITESVTCHVSQTTNDAPPRVDPAGDDRMDDREDDAASAPVVDDSLVQSVPEVVAGDVATTADSAVLGDSTSQTPAEEAPPASTTEATGEASAPDTSADVEEAGDAPKAEGQSVGTSSADLQLLLSRLNDMKVAELRAELEKRGARFKSNSKKADLVLKLKHMIETLLDDEDTVADTVKGDWWATRITRAANDDPPAPDADALPSAAAPAAGDSAEAAATACAADDSNDLKRKVVDDSPTAAVAKRTRSDDDASPAEHIVAKKVVDGCVFVKGGENLTVITLHEALNHQRYDQFEMSIVSEVIRESLIHHFSHYLLSTLIHNHHISASVKKEDKAAPPTPLASGTTSDAKAAPPLQVNYVHVSFAYFDSSHCGYLLAEDLAKLLNNANFTLSKRAFNLLVKSEDRVAYRDLAEPPQLLSLKPSASPADSCSVTAPAVAGSQTIVDVNGTVYDIIQLIERSERDDKLKVKLNEELTANKDKIDQLKEHISELESKQKKMTTATEKQNDEICALKREREVLKSKYDSMRKVMESASTAINDVLKSQSEEQK